MYSMRLPTLPLASARSCFTSTGPISLYTFASSFKRSNSYNHTTQRSKRRKTRAFINQIEEKKRRLTLRTSSFSPSWMVYCFLTWWFLEKSEEEERVEREMDGWSHLELGFGNLKGNRSRRRRMLAFLNFAEGFGLGFEISLKLFDRRRWCHGSQSETVKTKKPASQKSLLWWLVRGWRRIIIRFSSNFTNRTKTLFKWLNFIYFFCFFIQMGTWNFY